MGSIILCKWLRQTGRRLAENADGLFIAEIISVWENRQAYDDFMENEHDRIYEENEQKAAILSIEVMLYEGMNLSFTSCYITRTSDTNRTGQLCAHKKPL